MLKLGTLSCRANTTKHAATCASSMTGPGALARLREAEWRAAGCGAGLLRGLRAVDVVSGMVGVRVDRCLRIVIQC